MPTCLADVAARALATVRSAAADAGLKLSVALEPAAVLADPDRLGQVVLNLLSNAVKYTPAGGIITVTTRAVDGSAELEVRDTGPGLPEGEAAHVFERFWRGSAGRTAAGSGIGLAVAAELAAAHGGTLTAATLPRAPPSACGCPVTGHPHGGAQPTRRKPGSQRQGRPAPARRSFGNGSTGWAPPPPPRLPRLPTSAW